MRSNKGDQESYIKTKGKWFYLYRAVDKEGDTIDFMLSPKRDEATAKAFFTKAIGSSGLPEKITIDKSGANKAGIDAINLQLIVFYLLGFSMMQIDVRQIKYLNNIVEQGHRGIKRITKPNRMLKKGQHVYAKNSHTFEQFYSLAG